MQLDVMGIRAVFSTFDWNQWAKIRQHGCKERLKISKVAKFESDWKHTAPQSRGILQMVRDKFLLTCHNTNVFNISRLCGTISSLSFDISPLNLVIMLPYSNAHPSAVSMDIHILLCIKRWKNRGLTVYSVMLRNDQRPLKVQIIDY